MLVVAGTLPFDHVGVPGGLPVDRPRGAVVVRRRLARLVVDVRENLEAEVLVLVQHLQAERRVIAAGRGEELLVGEQALEILAHGFASGGTRIALQRRARVVDELLEFVGHAEPPCLGERMANRAVRRKGSATSSVCSLPPCGGGLGRGVGVYDLLCRYDADPHPRPLPARGRGARQRVIATPPPG